MQKHFYSDIIEIHTVYSALDSLNLSLKEKEELIVIIDSTVHETIIDIALTHLPTHAKKPFLTHISTNQHEKALVLLKKHVADIEQTIKNEIESLKKAFHKDIEILKKM